MPAASTGNLNITATTADLVGSLAVQAAATRFTIAGDLRLTGVFGNNPNVFPQASGSLVSTGVLSLQAGQIYPSTDTAFTIASASKVALLANGPAPSAVVGGRRAQRLRAGD